MRVNIYAEEMTDRVEIIRKEIDGHTYTGLRLYLELPVTHNGDSVRGPFMHRPGDDDSAAITFWGKRDLRGVLRRMSAALDAHYREKPTILFTSGVTDYLIDNGNRRWMPVQTCEPAQCDQAPTGWSCTREKGHAGPCAAQRASNVDELRQLIGERLSTKLYELMDKGKQAFDACDAYNIDMILDEIMPLVRSVGL